MTKPLNILLVSHGLPPENVGGVEQHVQGLALALRDLGHRVTIYARTGRPGNQGTLIEEELAPGIPAVRVVYRHEDLQRLPDLYKNDLLDGAFARFLDGRTFDVVHLHHMTGLSTGIVHVLQQARIRTVITLHDYWMICPRGQMWHREERRCDAVEPTTCAACLQPTFGGLMPGDAPAAVATIHKNAIDVLQTAQQIVAPSARTLQPFVAMGLDAGKCTVVENGVDTIALDALPAPTFEGPLRLGYLGTLIPSKGLDLLVAACKTLDRDTYRLDIHGNAVPYHGDDGFLTRVFGQLEPGDPVTYHGPYQTNDLPGILSEIDILISPARWHEAFGLTVREALAAGRPVVTTRVGGLEDSIADGVEGRLVPPDDIAALSQALQQMITNRAPVHAMSRAARRRARSFAAMAEELAEIYCPVAGTP